jgi:hypothetical protein
MEQRLEKLKQNNEQVESHFITATGGTITTCGDYKIHTFTGPGTFTVSVLGNACGSNTVDYLVVAGGGSGGGNAMLVAVVAAVVLEVIENLQELHQWLLYCFSIRSLCFSFTSLCYNISNYSWRWWCFTKYVTAPGNNGSNSSFFNNYISCWWSRWWRSSMH